MLRTWQLQIKLEFAKITWMVSSFRIWTKYSVFRITIINFKNTKGKYHAWKISESYVSRKLEPYKLCQKMTINHSKANRRKYFILSPPAFGNLLWERRDRKLRRSLFPFQWVFELQRCPFNPTCFAIMHIKGLRYVTKPTKSTRKV